MRAVMCGRRVIFVYNIDHQVVAQVHVNIVINFFDATEVFTNLVPSH